MGGWSKQFKFWNSDTLPLHRRVLFCLPHTPRKRVSIDIGILKWISLRLSSPRQKHQTVYILLNRSCHQDCRDKRGSNTVKSRVWWRQEKENKDVLWWRHDKGKTKMCCDDVRTREKQGCNVMTSRQGKHKDVLWWRQDKWKTKMCCNDVSTREKQGCIVMTTGEGKNKVVGFQLRWQWGLVGLINFRVKEVQEYS